MPEVAFATWQTRTHLGGIKGGWAGGNVIENFGLLAAAVNSTVVAGENPTVGSTVWLPAASIALGR
jgi:hypothetical protein